MCAGAIEIFANGNAVKTTGIVRIGGREGREVLTALSLRLLFVLVHIAGPRSVAWRDAEVRHGEIQSGTRIQA